MHFSTLAVATLSAVASAKTIKIDVGNGGLTFQPNDIKADAGDILEFHYYPKNHSVAAADFATPCKPKAQAGFFSGYVPSTSGEAKEVFQVTVNDTKPIWFYCSQASHCENGMVGAVNANANKTLAAFKDAAAKVKDTTAPDSVFGGVLSKSSGGSTSTGSGSSATTTAAAGTGANTASATSSSTSTAKSSTPTTNAAASLGSVGGALAAAVAMAVAFAA